jgi:fermentation-respiration switch protein FrsA (DUF1100 family)
VARTLYPFLPVHLLLRTEFNSIQKIQGINVPLLMMHGAKDSIIPIELGRRLFAAANDPKQFYEIPNADHNDTFLVGGDRYYETVTRFVRGIPSLAPGS